MPCLMTSRQRLDPACCIESSAKCCGAMMSLTGRVWENLSTKLVLIPGTSPEDAGYWDENAKARDPLCHACRHAVDDWLRDCAGQPEPSI